MRDCKCSHPWLVEHAKERSWGVPVAAYDADMADCVAIACAALVHDGRVLMVHRRPSREHYPDCWDLAGGHVEPGESPEAAVRRECFEELGVLVRDPAPITLTISDPGLEMHAFVVTDWDGEPHNAAPDEHDGLRWYRPSELAGLTVADRASLPGIRRAVDVGMEGGRQPH